MNWGFFEPICEMPESIPTKSLLRAADAERKMGEGDLDKKWTKRDDYVSGLEFCNFLILAVWGIYDSIVSLPSEHRAFYRKTLRRLVEVGELPSEIIAHFDNLFLPAFDSPESGGSFKCLMGSKQQIT